MDTWAYVLIITMAAVILFGIPIIVYSHRKKIKRLEEEANKSYIAGKEEAVSYYREVLDRIPSDLNTLNSMSEKELLVNIVKSLAGYGRRIDRIEDKLSYIYNYQKYIDIMNCSAIDLEKRSIELCEKYDTTNENMKALNACISNSEVAIKKLNNSVGNVGDLNKKIYEKLSDINEASKKLQNIESIQSNIIREMNNSFDVYGETPMVKLRNIEQTTLNCFETLNDVVSDISNMNEQVYSIKSTVKDIDNNTSDSSYHDIDDVYNEVYDVKRIMDDDDLKSTVSSIYSEVTSIYSVVDDVKSMLNNA